MMNIQSVDHNKKTNTVAATNTADTVSSQWFHSVARRSSGSDPECGFKSNGIPYRTGMIRNPLRGMHEGHSGP